jgi:hypothetical protein
MSHLNNHSFADSLAKVPVELVIDVTRFEGVFMVWIGPPPSDRWGFEFTCHDPVPTPVCVYLFSAQLSWLRLWQASLLHSMQHAVLGLLFA